jgi:hypothetical protein
MVSSIIAREREDVMAHHIFYPSSELPNQVISYAAGLHNHHKEFGDVTGNGASELKDAVTHAKKLQPLAEEIETLQTQLAAKLDAYHKAAAPLWTEFSERLGYARTFAEKKSNKALDDFLLAYRHNAGRHAAKVASGGTPPTT